MIRLHSLLTFCCAATIAVGGAVTAHAAVACESLASLKIDDGSITAAHAVTAGQFLPPAPVSVPAPPPLQGSANAIYSKLPAFCRVEATLTPSSDSAIHIEVWLPASGWNGKLVEAGNGAFAGSIVYGSLADLLLKGYAATNSDTGHTGDNGRFAVGHPEKLIDFGYRAMHVDVVAAKAVVAAYYSNAATKSYFQGCSTGGRQAYGEAQRYPADFDGIVAGAPGINFTRQTGAELAIVKQVHNDPASFIPADKLKMLHAAVIAACDELDGVKDGVIENPLKCHFDPNSLLCKSGNSPDCLSAPQAALVAKIYAGVTDSSGKLIFAGLPPGTESIWSNTLVRTEPMTYGVDAYRQVAMQDPGWNFSTFDVDRDIPAADKKVGAIMNNFDPDLKPFFAHGGKLLGYHGWSDGMNSPLNHLQYYKSVAEVMGSESKMTNSYRLFYIPGMGHCGGGEGTSTFDLLAALDNWVTTGIAPESIQASRVRDGNVDRTRPLCPYPEQAVYSGTGSTDEAANFSCKTVK